MAEPKKNPTRTAARKTTERKTRTRKKKTPAIAHEHIAERAYYLSLERGGDAFENWIRAERELAAV